MKYKIGDVVEVIANEGAPEGILVGPNEIIGTISEISKVMSTIPKFPYQLKEVSGMFFAEGELKLHEEGDEDRDDTYEDMHKPSETWKGLDSVIEELNNAEQELS